MLDFVIVGLETEFLLLGIVSKSWIEVNDILNAASLTEYAQCTIKGNVVNVEHIYLILILLQWEPKFREIILTI
jgi:hypothetical protein